MDRNGIFYIKKVPKRSPPEINSILQNGSDDLDSSSDGTNNAIEPLPGLETILEELLKEDGLVSFIFHDHLL